MGVSGLGWAVCLAVMAQTGVGAATESPAIRAFASWLNESRTLEGRFDQVLLSSALGAGPSERGRVYLARPGRVRWEYEDPEPKTALVLGDRTLLYLPADHQLIRGHLEPGNVLPRLLAGERQLRDAFDLSLQEGDAASGGVRIALAPRGPAGGLVRAEVTVDPRSGALLEADVTDAAGNRMRYRFSGWRRNRALPEGVFALEPPPGTEIVNVD